MTVWVLVCDSMNNLDIYHVLFFAELWCLFTQTLRRAFVALRIVLLFHQEEEESRVAFICVQLC